MLSMVKAPAIAAPATPRALPSIKTRAAPPLPGPNTARAPARAAAAICVRDPIAATPIVSRKLRLSVTTSASGKSPWRRPVANSGMVNDICNPLGLA